MVDCSATVDASLVTSVDKGTEVVDSIATVDSKLGDEGMAVSVVNSAIKLDDGRSTAVVSSGGPEENCSTAVVSNVNVDEYGKVISPEVISVEDEPRVVDSIDTVDEIGNMGTEVPVASSVIMVDAPSSTTVVSTVGIGENGSNVVVSILKVEEYGRIFPSDVSVEGKEETVV